MQKTVKGSKAARETINFSVRMDADAKRRLDEFCAGAGMNTNVALNMFAKYVSREWRLPFKVESDPFWGEANISHLAKLKADADAGRNMHEHELIEDED